jgi:transposase
MSHAATKVRPQADPGLSILGLSVGEAIRFRRRTGDRWMQGIVDRREPDGRIGLTDSRGAARAVVVEQIEVRCCGPRGGQAWEPLAHRASRSEQLSLL